MPRNLIILPDSSLFAQLAAVKHASYISNEFYAAAYPIQETALMINWLQAREELEFQRNPKPLFATIIDDAGKDEKVLAWMRLKVPGELTLAAQNIEPESTVAGIEVLGFEDEDPMKKFNLPSLPTGSNLAMQIQLREGMMAMKKKYYNPEMDYSMRSPFSSLPPFPIFPPFFLVAYQLLKWLPQ